MENTHHLPCGVKLGFKIARLALQAASVAAAFCIVKEVHKVHHAIKHCEKK